MLERSLGKAFVLNFFSDLDAPSPLVHQFTPRISREEYERQAKEYTNRQLNLLSDQIRRDPSLIKNSIHYGNIFQILQNANLDRIGAEVTSVKRNDQILKVVFWSILTCLLFFALYTPLESPMNNRTNFSSSDVISHI